MTAFDGNFKTQEVAKPSSPTVCEWLIHSAQDAWAKTTLGNHAQVEAPAAKKPEPQSLDFNTPMNVAAFDKGTKSPYSDAVLAKADQNFEDMLKRHAA
ncbi:MAG TPA: hypothetical protein V6C72_13775 [Chroococcales cyanobacterium]